MNIPSVRFLFVCFVLGFVVADGRGQDVAPPASLATHTWHGTLDAKTRKFRMEVRFTAMDGQAPMGKLISHDEGAREFKLNHLNVSDTELTFQITATKAKYTGKRQGGMIEGTWEQRGNTLPLNFQQGKEPPTRKIKAIWKGRLDAVIQKLDVAFIELESGEILFDSVTQKVGGFVVTNEKAEKGDVHWKVDGIRGTFRGKRSDDNKKIEGKWKQGFTSLSLTLERTNDAASLAHAAPKRPQTPRAPFPYQVENVSFSSGPLMLAGTLTIPKQPRAAVVLISGSGPQNRDEELLGHKPFWVIADHLARNGIATLRYDDRGVGESEGEFGDATTDDFADDAEAAASFFKSQDWAKAVPIGLCGHSEGGLVAPIVAARNNEIDFIVLMAGPGVNGEKISRSQSRLILEAANADQSTKDHSERLQTTIFAAIHALPDASPKELEVEIQKRLKEKQDGKPLSIKDVQEVKLGVRQISSPWFRRFLVLEPTEALSKVQCPTLVLQGEKDLQVDAKLNVPAIEAALEKASNDAVETVVFPNLNHLFQNCKTGSPAEYEGIEETIDPAVLAKLANWMAAQSAGK